MQSAAAYRKQTRQPPNFRHKRSCRQNCCSAAKPELQQRRNVLASILAVYPKTLSLRNNTTVTITPFARRRRSQQQFARSPVPKHGTRLWLINESSPRWHACAIPITTEAAWRQRMLTAIRRRRPPQPPGTATNANSASHWRNIRAATDCWHRKWWNSSSKPPHSKANGLQSAARRNSTNQYPMIQTCWKIRLPQDRTPKKPVPRISEPCGRKNEQLKTNKNLRTDYINNLKSAGSHISDYSQKGLKMVVIRLARGGTKHRPLLQRHRYWLTPSTATAAFIEQRRLQHTP